MRRRGVGGLGLAMVVATLAAGEPRAEGDVAKASETPPVENARVMRLYGGGSGRFEIIAEPGPEALRLVETGEAAWSEWRDSLALPSRLSSAILVRLVPAENWSASGKAFFTTSDPGGVVTVWIRAGEADPVVRERLWLSALAEGVLRRKAVLLGVSPERARTPAWLVEGAAGSALTAARPAMLDAWQAAVRGADAPERLRDVLFWDGNAAAPEFAARAAAAQGAWLWLRGEGARSGAWARLVEALIAGEAPGAALAREYAPLVTGAQAAREWELVWRVGLARLAAARATPMLDAAESRRRIERLARIVAWDASSGTERVLPAAGAWEERREAWPRGEREARAALLETDLPRLHPFYLNAAVSLGRAWQALAEGREARWRAASAAWKTDWAEGRSLEEASKRLLDEAESR